MEINLRATSVFERNYNSTARIVVDQGGTRSSKTYSLAQLFVIKLFEEENTLFTISRKTLPALKATAMRDFFDVLKANDLYDEKNHNKTAHTYKVGTNEVEFVSVDEPQKIRGRKRDWLWMNEANEFTLEDFRQLILRTPGRAFLDYNPSDEFHWIYEHVLPRDDCEFIQSTYLDNPFLDEQTIKEIERLKKVDPNYWRIYGLGERGISEATIYTHWQYIDELPAGGEDVYGVDFGYNVPSAITQNRIKDDEVYTEERLYKSHLTNSELILELKDMKISGSAPIYCDNAEPDRIREIKQAGFNAIPADKAVGKGIDSLKSRQWYITKRSVNSIKEARSYKWKEKDDAILDEPVKVNDHAMDSVRYAVYTHLSRPQMITATGRGDAI